MGELGDLLQPFREGEQNSRAIAAQKQARQDLEARVQVLLELEGEHPRFHFRDATNLPLCRMKDGKVRLVSLVEARDLAKPCPQCRDIHTRIGEGWT
jgi:hypothetical protein